MIHNSPLNEGELKDAFRYDESICASIGPEARSFNQAIPLTENAMETEAFRQMVGFHFSENDIQITPFQGGLKYGIIHVSIQNESGIGEYIIHFPRTSDEHSEIWNDFTILHNLHELAESSLTSTGKELLNILDPLGVIEGKEGDALVPLLVTPFQKDRWEVSLLHHCSSLNLFRPATSVNGKFEYINIQTEKRLLDTTDSEVRIIIEQNKRLLQATTLLWILLGRKLPKEFQISAGDWIAKANPNGSRINFMLSTIRGGELQNCDTTLQYFIKLFATLEDMIIPNPLSPDGTENYPFNPYRIFFFNTMDPFIKFPEGKSPKFNVNAGPLYPFRRLFSDVREMILPLSARELYPMNRYNNDLACVERDKEGVNFMYSQFE